MQQYTQTLKEDYPSQAFRVGEWYVIPERSVLMSLNGDVVDLEMMAIELLNYMALNRNEVLSVDTLMDNIWEGKIVTQGTVRRIISVLRKALQDDSKHPTYIQNIPKRGYVLIAEVAFDETIKAFPTQQTLARPAEKEALQTADAQISVPQENVPRSKNMLAAQPCWLQ